MSKYDNYGGASRTPYDEFPPELDPVDDWTPELDAYGHLTWTVGDSDWLACLDVDISPCGRFYAYHVVVDCESGGFTDTPESGRGPIEEIDTLKGLAGYWLGIHENHEPGPDVETDPEGSARMLAEWPAHIEECKRIAQERREQP